MSLSINPNSVIVESGQNKLCVVQGPMIWKALIGEIAAISSQKLPDYAPDGASVIPVFHVDDKEYFFGPKRTNAVLHTEGKEILTKDGTQFPLQASSANGGAFKDPSASLEDGVTSAMGDKYYTKEPIPGVEKAQEIMKKVIGSIKNGQGRENSVVIHTADEWKMKLITGVVHIRCTQEDLNKIKTAIKTIMDAKLAAGTPSRFVADYDFYETAPIIQNSLETYLKDEKEKATNAYEKFKDAVAVVFNDLAVATLSLNGGFKATSYAELNLS